MQKTKGLVLAGLVLFSLAASILILLDVTRESGDPDAWHDHLSSSIFQLSREDDLAQGAPVSILRMQAVRDAGRLLQAEQRITELQNGLLRSAAKNVTERDLHRFNALSEALERVAVALRHILRQHPAAASQGAFEPDARMLAHLVEEQVYAVLYKLQHPSDCRTARLLVCDINKACGYGCQMHHLIHCFTTAIANDRTLVFFPASWSYMPEEDIFQYERLFEPISACSIPPVSPYQPPQERFPTWTYQREKGPESPRILYLPIVEDVEPPAPSLPPNLPRDLAYYVSLFHAKPSVWWVGVLLRFLIRPNRSLRRDIDKLLDRFDLHPLHNYLSMHIRRTDKLFSEAQEYKVEDYMAIAERFFKEEAIRRIQAHQAPLQSKKIFVVTDEPAVLQELEQKYPTYSFKYQPESTQLGHGHDRYSEASLKHLVEDVLLLSSGSFLVCTYSSQICRLAYELMQVSPFHARGIPSSSEPWRLATQFDAAIAANDAELDRSGRIQSLDSFYYYGGAVKQTHCLLLNTVLPVGDAMVPFYAGDEFIFEDDVRGGLGEADGFSRRIKKKVRFPRYLTVPCAMSDVYENILHYPLLAPAGGANF